MTEHVRDGRRRDATPRGGRESPHLPPDRGFYGQTLYKKYLDQGEKDYQEFLKPEKLDCEQALKVLGLLSHMWQDYYAHGVEKDDSWFGAVIGKIKGTPDNLQMIPVGFGADGFRGGHGGAFRLLNPFARVEPGDRADDSDVRRRQAKWFTIEKFQKFLPVWVNACKCEKEWWVK